MRTASTPKPRVFCTQISRTRTTQNWQHPPRDEREFGSLGRNVQPKNPAPGRLQQLHRQLAKQAKSDHRHHISELHFGRANSVQGNCSHGGESSFIERTRAVGNLRDQQSRNANGFRVHRVSSTGASDAIADRDVRHAFANPDHDAGAAVAERSRLVETAADRLHRRKHSVAPNFVEDLAHQIRPGFRFLNEILAGKLRRSPLRTGRHQRGANAHQHAARQQLRRRDFRDRNFAGARLLQNLLHAVATCCD